MLAEGKMHESGMAMVELAKEKGTWNDLYEVEELNIPPDLQLLLDQNPVASDYFSAFPKSVKRGIFEWILNAKRTETRQNRINETVRLALDNIRALFQIKT